MLRFQFLGSPAPNQQQSDSREPLGRPRKIRETVLNGDSGSDSAKENEGDIEQSRCMKCLYGMKQKTVVSYAQMHSVAAAARHFTIPRTTIAHWMADWYFKQEMTKHGVKKGAGRPLTYSTDIEEQLLVWVLENRDLHLPITIPLLKAKALELIGTECPDFKASSGWAYKFMHRHSLVLRARTSMAQELPATLEERIRAFHHQIKRVAEINKFEVVGNMDETPLYFDVVPGRVLDKKGKQSVVYHRKPKEALDRCPHCSC